jgi:predicted AAA+ superfamily ATPase
VRIRNKPFTRPKTRSLTAFPDSICVRSESVPGTDGTRWAPGTDGTLRRSSKRHFADPSLAVGALGLSIEKLTADLQFFGLLFESLAIRDLRIYAEANDGEVYHYRDSRGMEIDAIVEYANGTWGAFEIKLGIGAADAAAANLLQFAKKIDTEKTKAPAALTVVTGNGFAHRRADGVDVVPLSVLTV